MPLAYLVAGLPSGCPVTASPVVATIAKSQAGLIVLGMPLRLSCRQPRLTSRARSSSLVFPQRASPAIIGGASAVHRRASVSAPVSAPIRSAAVRASSASRFPAAAFSCTTGSMRTSRFLNLDTAGDAQWVNDGVSETREPSGPAASADLAGRRLIDQEQRPLGAL